MRDKEATSETALTDLLTALRSQAASTLEVAEKATPKTPQEMAKQIDEAFEKHLERILNGLEPKGTSWVAFMPVVIALKDARTTVPRQAETIERLVKALEKCKEQRDVAQNIVCVERHGDDCYPDGHYDKDDAEILEVLTEGGE